MIYALDLNYYNYLSNVAKEVEIYKKTKKHDDYQVEIQSDYVEALLKFVPIKSI